MKKLFVALAGASLAASMMQASAEDVGNGFDVSANVGLVSDYLWRGISQSNNDAAIQGGIDLSHSSGIYAGTWWSSLSGWYSPNTDYASTEEDYYVGYKLGVTKDVTLDLRYTTFVYQGDNGGNFDEYHAGISGFGASLGVDYADNVSPGNSTTFHAVAGYAYTFPADVTVAANYGYYDFKDNFYGDANAYDYWNIGVSKKFVGITWGLSYNNTNLSGEACSALSGSITQDNGKARDACDEKFVFSATKAL